MPLYDEIEIEDFTYDPETLLYSYPCPCGDRFKVSLEDLWDGEDVANCESCTLYIEVIYDEEDLPPLPEDDDDDEEDEENNSTSIESDVEGEKDTRRLEKNHGTNEVAVNKALEKLSVTSQWIFS